MISLLDANVLLALGDENHPHHSAALRFMEDVAIRQGWATCPLTENAFLRIMGRVRPAGGGMSPEDARLSLHSIIANPGHNFWTDDLSLTDSLTFPSLPAAKDLTDIYLLALAVKHRARFATFDAGIDPSLVPGGPQALHLITP
jgi:toxin-antitoxin system PIN domain toxin